MGQKHIAEALEPAPVEPTKEQSRKQGRKAARKNWKKVQKFKNTLGRVMALQTQTHLNKTDQGQESTRSNAIFSYKSLFDSGRKADEPRQRKVQLKQSNILQMYKASPKKRTLAPLQNTPRVKVN